ncbi:MAG TPA: HlyD family efflux transporter periplasmic adaptor subunit [Anaerolineales bacterium]|nr:HlyD family efflux transporter periplasmic adaptor subunit [Anaerolineales bacterium]
MKLHEMRRFIPLVFLVVLVIAGVIYLARISGPQDGPLQVAGTIETTEVRVGPEVAGRVAEVNVLEGAQVAAGDVLLRLDDALLQAQKARAQAGLETAEAGLRTAQAAVDSARLQQALALTTARAQEASARAVEWRVTLPPDSNLPAWYFSPDEELRAAQAEAAAAETALHEEQARQGSVLAAPLAGQLEAAERELLLSAAEVEAARAVRDRADLARQNEDLLDTADDRYEASRERLRDAQSAYDDLLSNKDADAVLAARAALAAAQARLDAARDRVAKLQTGERSLQVELAAAVVQQAEAAAAQARRVVAQARADLAVLEVQLSKTVIRAPVGGVVITRSVEVGEVLTPGSAAFAIGQLSDLRLTVFVPEDRYGTLHLNQAAQITVDSFPSDVFRATVVRIAEQAEFTPRNVQTDEGRRTTVFAVELALQDSGGRLKPGMPATVVFEE